ncbi:MAG: deoxyguanosinetriphosphate triphosphohydrolase [Planctomycetes bacterium]|nr:deoxyguanosinetriphosphate triphosphohydrolase [Planctomycetota bacterium]
MSATLAPYAVRDDSSRGRRHADALAQSQSPFELDRQRVLNCMAFRRLMHKTQVFVSDSSDHFRTRLTHTLEVVAQAQRLAKLLHLNDRLAGAIALAHDLGHPPFGHAGEVELSAIMKNHGGFEHNLQSLRVVDFLEHPYPEFRGLNLTFELRESLLKHRTRFDNPAGDAADSSHRDLMDSGPQCPLEGQVANLADQMAYTLHDTEDGLVDGALTEEILAPSRIWRLAADEVRAIHPAAPVAAVRRPILDRIATRLHQDAAAESLRRINDAGVKSPDDARVNAADLIGFSSSVQDGIDELQAILLQALYRNHRVIRMDSKARRLIRELFDAYLAEPNLMPERYVTRLSTHGPHRVICDYIAGMTDRFCQEEHRRLFAPFHFD